MSRAVLTFHRLENKGVSTGTGSIYHQHSDSHFIPASGYLAFTPVRIPMYIYIRITLKYTAVCAQTTRIHGTGVQEQHDKGGDRKQSADHYVGWKTPVHSAELCRIQLGRGLGKKRGGGEAQ